ncbi:MAG: hypothetical protein ACI89Z_001450 [Porticoccus sp.]|jgi:hypothetical protein
MRLKFLKRGVTNDPKVDHQPYRLSVRMIRLLSILVMTAIPWAACISDEVVKKSNSEICHDQNSPYYSRTKHLQPYNELQRPEDYQQGSVSSFASRERQQSTRYDRSQFGGWSDEDHDCLNTRHELLIKLSTGTIQTGSNACTVSRGRWNDPLHWQDIL